MSERSGAMPYAYSLYGIRVTSDIPFEFPPVAANESRVSPHTPLAHVDFVHATGREYSSIPTREELDDAGFLCRPLLDGSTYLGWAHLYEFHVTADGRVVAYRSIDGCDRAVFQNFLFGQALAVALVRQGIEPLHAAVVRVEDYAVGFLGDCTFGKSTLMASFLKAGHRALTDDLLILGRRNGEHVALPGSGRIKLLPDSASEFLDDPTDGPLLNPDTTKRSFILDDAVRQATALPLRQLFVLPDPDERDHISSMAIQPVSRAEMVRELLKNTFTGEILDRSRLERQFAFASQVASDVEGFRLRYPSGLQHLPELRRAILNHLRDTVDVGQKTLASLGHAP